MIWAPFTTTNGQWIANKVLQGLVGAPIESLCEISVSDVVSDQLWISLQSPGFNIPSVLHSRTRSLHGSLCFVPDE